MKTTRRNFIALGGIAAAGLSLGKSAMAGSGYTLKPSNGKIKLFFEPYNLALKHVFTIAGSSRTSTPVMLTRIEYDGITGFGEASMPPYLGESQETASRFLSKVDLSPFNDPFHIEDILDYVDQIDEGNRAAKASVDIALHDLVGKLIGQPWHRLWGLNPDLTPNTSFTIGIDTAEVVKQKVAEA
ncbi:MAG: dipeptide epimerase, partial [Bacteroidia bacterium]|nr:dipeptide epimerase [Bacteroidia bacterium]